MSSATQSALKCFQENLDRFAPVGTQPEKLNLYNGLAALAEAVEGLEGALDALSRNQVAIQNTIDSLRQ